MARCRISRLRSPAWAATASSSTPNRARAGTSPFSTFPPSAPRWCFPPAGTSATASATRVRKSCRSSSAISPAASTRCAGSRCARSAPATWSCSRRRDPRTSVGWETHRTRVRRCSAATSSAAANSSSSTMRSSSRSSPPSASKASCSSMPAMPFWPRTASNSTACACPSALACAGCHRLARCASRSASRSTLRPATTSNGCSFPLVAHHDKERVQGSEGSRVQARNSARTLGPSDPRTLRVFVIFRTTGGVSMTLSKTLALVLVPVLLAAAGASAQLKIGYVDLQRALNESEPGKAAKERFKVQVDRLQVDLKKKKDQLDSLKEQLEKKSSVMKEEEARNLQKDYERKLRDFERSYKDSQGELQQKDNELTVELLKELQGVIEQFGKENGYSMILEQSSSSVLYGSPELDLTEQVIARYNARSK